MSQHFYSHINNKIQERKDGGTYMRERVISSAILSEPSKLLKSMLSF